VGASLSQTSDIGAPDSVTTSLTGMVFTESGSSWGSEGDLIEALERTRKAGVKRIDTITLAVT